MNEHKIDIKSKQPLFNKHFNAIILILLIQ